MAGALSLPFGEYCLKAAHVMRTALFTCGSQIIVCIAQAAANAAAQASAAGDNAATIAQKAKEAAKQAAASAQGTAYSASDVGIQNPLGTPAPLCLPTHLPRCRCF